MKKQETLLDVQGLSKQFGKRVFFRDVSFKIRRQSIVGLLGPNGAGKSTVMKCLIGVYQPTGGQIKLTPGNAIGALIEEPALYPFLTGKQHLKLFSPRNNRSLEVARFLGLTESALGKPVKDSSLGMKQKLGISLAFAGDPQLIILDEPMNGLDFRSTARLRDLLLAEKQAGKSFLICSHVLSELQKIIDEIIILNGGRVTFESTIAEIKHRFPVKVQITVAPSPYLAGMDLGEAVVRGNRVLLPDQRQLNSVLGRLIKNRVRIIAIETSPFDLEQALLTELGVTSNE